MWLLLVMLKTSNHKLEYRIGKIIFKILKEQKKIYDFIGEKIVWNTQKQ